MLKTADAKAQEVTENYQFAFSKLSPQHLKLATQNPYSKGRNPYISETRF
jgi:hypothetical protein